MVMAVLLLPLLAIGARAGVAVAASDSGVLQQVFRSVFVAQEIGVLDFHLLDLGQYLHRQVLRPEPSPEKVERLTRWFADRASQRRGTGAWFGQARGANLLMVQVESLQSFVIGFEVAGQEVTPALNRFVTDSLWFRAVNDQTHHGRSSDSELTTQVSLLPLSRGTAAFRCAGNDFTGLAEILSSRGYSCRSAVPFTGSFWNRRNTHWAYGFSDSLFADDFAPGETIGWGLNDRDFLLQMVPRLEEMERPFCAFLITLSLHHPFADFPDHHKTLELGELDGQPFGNYLHTMHFFDQAWERFVAELEAAGIADSTVIVLWGDHDAGLGWEAETAAAMDIRWHEPDWYLSERVPLVVHLPGGDAETVDRVAGQADVAPTVLALLGVDPAPYALVGRNLLGAPGDEPVPGAYGSWIDSQHLWVARGAGPDEGRCYQLATLEMVPSEACQEGNLEFRRLAEVSQSVLEDDLQQRLHEALVASLDRLGGG
jgi:phosphoglycerol transferase MdoB-like AlkP superfamily enzyme